MNRLQKHCVLVSTGLHLLLLVALLFGSGFRSKQPEQPDIKPFHMMSSSVMESLLDDPADATGKQEPEPVIKTPVAEPPPEEIMISSGGGSATGVLITGSGSCLPVASAGSSSSDSITEEDIM